MLERQKTVLVIDDDKLNLKLFISMIHLTQYRAVGAEDALSGIRLAKKLIPDLILMDICMPGVDGISAIKIIKSDPEIKDVPIIAVTGMSSQDIKEAAINAGCVKVITKPVFIEPFLEKISAYLVP